MMPHRSLKLAVAAAAAVLAAAPAAFAQNDFSNVKIEATPLPGGVTMLTGAGGNIGVFAGKDGVLLVDGEYRPLYDRIKAAVAKISEKPVVFLVNTHWHGDHTGCNEDFAENGAIIVAQENVRERMSTDQFMEAFGRSVPASPPKALPVITFQNSLEFHWNGDDVRIFHVPHAHTDGDAVVRFTKANVVHMGDNFFNGHYPIIDYGSDGSIYGMIETADKVLAFTNDDTKIIPGHGPLGTRAELQDYRDMLVTVRDRIEKLLEQGKTAEEIIAAKPTKDLDQKWGKSKFMTPERFVTMAVKGMIQAKKGY